jgi:hypothetical protein
MGQYHEIVRQLRPLVYSLDLNNPPSTVTVLHLESRASKINDLTNRGTVDVKWRVLEFGHLQSSALKYRGLLGMTPWQTVLKFTADCQAPRSGSKENV